MEPLPEPTATSIACVNCNYANPADVKFCPHCSYPIGGSEDDKSRFRVRVMRNKQLIKDSRDKIRTAKIIMYGLAAITFFTGVYQGFWDDYFTGLIINCVLALIYLIMIAWADKNPFAATLSVFVLYITINLLNAFLDPATIFGGILLKIFIIAGLIKGITSAKQAQDSLVELERVKAATDRDR